MKIRISREQYYMEVANATSKRSTCNILVGAVAIKNNRIILTAYNGAPAKEAHCIDEGCIKYHNHCIRTIHAEQNLIVQAARNGIVLEGAIVYCTHEPCLECKKLLYAVGVTKVIYRTQYEDDRTELIRYNKLEVRQMEEDEKIISQKDEEDAYDDDEDDDEIEFGTD